MDTGLVIKLFGFLTIGAFILGAKAFQASQMKAQLVANPGMTLGNIAQSLQLNIVEGSPTYHLAHPPEQPFWATMIGLTLHERRFRLEGTFGALTSKLHLRAVERYLSVRRARLFEHREYDAALTIANVAPLPPFEVWLEASNDYTSTRPVTGLLDQQVVTTEAGKLHVSGGDPSVVNVVAPHAPLLSTLHYVHLIGRPGTLEFRFSTEISLATVVPRLPEIQSMMIAIANAASAQQAAA